MTFLIENSYGIHARVAMQIVNLVEQYSGHLNFVVNGKCVPGNSVIRLMQMGTKKGDIVRIEYLTPMEKQVEFESKLSKIIEG